MKTLKFFALLFVAVAMSCNFVACGGGDKDDPDAGTAREKLLVGTWQGTLLEYFEMDENGVTFEEKTPMEEGDMTVTVYDDHTFRFVYYVDEDVEVGSWSLAGSTLEIVYEGEQVNAHVLELTETTFRYEIVNEYGSYTEKGVYTFKRK